MSNIYFYNNFHNGDLHVSRTFIRYIMENIPAKKYYYMHLNAPKVLSDIENLNQIPISKIVVKKNDFGYFKDGKDYYINTWYGGYDFQYLKNQEMTINVIFNVFKRTLKELFNHEILEDRVYFLPKIDYSKFDLTYIDNLILKEKRKKVLICNNDVESGQSNNFDFNPIVIELAKKHSNILFILTNIFKGYMIEKDNIMYCNKIIPNVYENNLNEISYLSRFCDLIVGRYSGPQSFAGTKENFLNTNKTFINFVNGGSPNGYSYGDCSFGISSLLPEDKRAKFISSNNFKEESIIKVIGAKL